MLQIAELTKREKLYSEFLSEASRLMLYAVSHNAKDTSDFVSMYALLNRIRLKSPQRIVKEAENAIKYITDQFYQPNVTMEELHEVMAKAKAEDPLKHFSELCRADLLRMSKNGLITD